MKASYNANKFAFVVLNYCGFEVTIKCINSLQKRIKNNRYIIVIVDNGSPDNSGILLRNKYHLYDSIKVILLQENVGFSRGMNAGFKFAKDNGYNYISLINNDIEILSDDICDILTEDYDKYHYSVIGPHIDSPDSKSINRNPFYSCEKSDDEMLYEAERFINRASPEIKIKNLHLGGIYFYTRRIIANLYHRISPVNRYTQESEDNIVVNCALHGCFLSFSPTYVELYDGLEAVTFSYCEEWILYRICKMNNLIMMYDPRIRIFHNEHTVQKLHSKMEFKKYFFRIELELAAYKKVYKYIKNQHKLGYYI